MTAPTDVELVEAWLAGMQARSMSPATIKRRRCLMSSWRRHLDGRPLLEASPFDVERFMLAARAAATRRAYFVDLTLFYRWAVKRRLTAFDPTEDVGKPGLPKRLPRPLSDDDLARLLAVATGRERLWILFGAFAGLRVSEIARLHTDDLRDGQIVVRHGKGDKDRMVPMHPLIRRELALFPPGWVAPAEPCPDRPVQGSWVSVRLRRVMAEAGIGNTPHALRHTFCTMAARASNGNVVAVAALAGHTNIQTTMGYIVLTSNQADIVNSLGAGFAA